MTTVSDPSRGSLSNLTIGSTLTLAIPGFRYYIALLPTIGKVVEAVVARKVTEAVEAYSLLPTE